jgi:hypothetical protein
MFKLWLVNPEGKEGKCELCFGDIINYTALWSLGNGERKKGGGDDMP